MNKENKLDHLYREVFVNCKSEINLIIKNL